jgi:hypothetical protein
MEQDQEGNKLLRGSFNNGRRIRAGLTGLLVNETELILEFSHCIIEMKTSWA